MLKDILSLLDLDESITDISDAIVENENEIIIFAEIKKSVSCSCPECGQVGRIKDKLEYDINHTFSNFHSKKLILHLTKRKFVCKDCKKYWVQEIPLIKKGSTFTLSVSHEIINSFKETITFTKIAERFGLSVSRVIQLFDENVKANRTAFRKCVCLDETHFASSKYNKYIAVFSNGITGEIIDILQSRKYEYLAEYLSKISEIERNTVKFFTCDMNIYFRKIAKKFFKKAVIIVDFFHVTKLFTKIVNDARIKYMKTFERDSKEYKFLKKYRKFFLMNNENLDKVDITFSDTKGHQTDMRDALIMVARNDPSLFSSYMLYREFCNLFEDRKGLSKMQVEKNLEFIINKANNSLYKPLVTLSETLLEWSEEIINAYSDVNELKVSNAIAESNNNRIDKLIHISNGYKNFWRMRKRVLFIDRNTKKNNKNGEE